MGWAKGDLYYMYVILFAHSRFIHRYNIHISFARRSINCNFNNKRLVLFSKGHVNVNAFYLFLNGVASHSLWSRIKKMFKVAIHMKGPSNPYVIIILDCYTLHITHYCINIPC